MHLMVKDIDGHYVPAECCTFDREGNIDDVEFPCGADCYGDCENCIITKIMDDYANITSELLKINGKITSALYLIKEPY